MAAPAAAAVAEQIAGGLVPTSDLLVLLVEENAIGSRLIVAVLLDALCLRHSQLATELAVWADHGTDDRSQVDVALEVLAEFSAAPDLTCGGNRATVLP